MKRLSLLVAVVALSACSAPVWMRSNGPSVAERLLRDANVQIRAGKPAVAITILDEVVRRFPEDPVHDQALYELARALVLNANGTREYRRAVTHLDRLLREHPASAYTPDASRLTAVARPHRRAGATAGPGARR